MGRSILPACSHSSLVLLLLEPFPSDVCSRMLAPLLMYCGEPAIFCSSHAESIIRGCTTESAFHPHTPHALILPTRFPPHVPPPLCAHPYCKQYTSILMICCYMSFLSHVGHWENL